MEVNDGEILLLEHVQNPVLKVLIKIKKNNIIGTGSYRVKICHVMHKGDEWSQFSFISNIYHANLNFV